MYKILKIPIKDTTMSLTGKSTWGLSSNVFLQSSHVIEWNWYAIAITPINRSMFFKIIMWWGTKALLSQIMSNNSAHMVHPSTLSSNWHPYTMSPYATHPLVYRCLKLHVTASLANVTSTTHSHQDISHTKITWKHIPY